MNFHRPRGGRSSNRERCRLGGDYWMPAFAGMTAIGSENDESTNKAAVPRRSCRQPVAARRAESRRARSAPKAKWRRRAQGGRGPRDQGRHQKTGSGRAAIDHRRRIPPLLVASRFPVGARRRRKPRHGHRHCLCRGHDAQRGHQSHRQARLLRSSDDRAFQIPQGEYDADAENDHSGAVGDLRPPGRDADRQVDLSRRSTHSSPISARPTRRRCAPSPTPVAAICSSTKSSSPCCAIRNTGSR